jgi:hypothetical protein
MSEKRLILFEKMDLRRVKCLKTEDGSIYREEMLQKGRKQ